MIRKQGISGPQATGVVGCGQRLRVLVLHLGLDNISDDTPPAWLVYHTDWGDMVGVRQVPWPSATADESGLQDKISLARTWLHHDQLYSAFVSHCYFYHVWQ